MPAAKKRKGKDKEAATPAKANPEAVPVPVEAVRKELKFKKSASKNSPQKSPQKSLKAKKSPQAVAVAEGSEVAEQEQEAMVVDGEGAVIPDSQKQPTPIPEDPEGREDQAEESEEAEENGE